MKNRKNNIKFIVNRHGNSYWEIKIYNLLYDYHKDYCNETDYKIAHLNYLINYNENEDDKTVFFYISNQDLKRFIKILKKLIKIKKYQDIKYEIIHKNYKILFGMRIGSDYKKNPYWLYMSIYWDKTGIMVNFKKSDAKKLCKLMKNTMSKKRIRF